MRESPRDRRLRSFPARVGQDSGRSAPCVQPNTPDGHHRENVRSARDVLPRSVQFSVATNVRFSVAIDTVRQRGRPDRYGGLSPRVRGSRPLSGVAAVDVGSIPACAGEPVLAYATPGTSGVYPRVCGGAPTRCSQETIRGGLSPRVRGSPHALQPGDDPRGSIPACAGEPPRAAARRRSEGVYPRVCGGAPTRCSQETIRGGLSPRVRGSRPLSGVAAVDVGSIPACAGEPVLAYATPGTSGVYPRVCGGAPTRCSQETIRGGLSPRVRGSPFGRPGCPGF